MGLMRLRNHKKKEDPSDINVRAKYAYLEACVSITGNVLLFIFKLILGIMINSIALITDAFHTLSDTATSGVVILGFKASKKAPDKEHPFGHGRFEHITTLVIAVLLFVVGAEFILQSYIRVVEGVEIVKNDYIIVIGIAVMLSSLIKEAMARYSFKLGRKINSSALIADGWHHRSDALTSIPVGIAIIGANYDLFILDPILGIVVAVLIIYTAVTLFRYSSDTLVGKSPDKETVSAIEKTAKGVNGVCGTHRITVHDYGTTKVVSLHIEVECDITAERAHNIAQEVEDRVAEVTKSSTIVHVDPHSEPRIDIKEVEKAVEEVLSDSSAVLFYHKVKITSAGDESVIDMHIVVDSEMPVAMSHNLSHHIKKELQGRFINCKVNTHIEPCNGECETCPGICTKK